MTAIQHIPERAPFNYADLIEYREGQITSLALSLIHISEPTRPY